MESQASVRSGDLSSPSPPFIFFTSSSSLFSTLTSARAFHFVFILLVFLVVIYLLVSWIIDKNTRPMVVRRAATLPEGPTGDFKGDIKVDDKLPTKKELEKAGDIEVYDKDKKAYKFSDLYSNTDGDQKHTYLIVFIRHFFCGNCQEYLRTLSLLLPPSSLPPQTSVIVIGCGAPLHIDQYIANTACAYPIYADPSKKLYQALRMTRTLNLGSRAPEYMNHTSITKLALRSIWQEFRAGRQMLSGGDFWQVGGEFVFETTPAPSPEQGKGETKVTWCHRMRNTRDHAELSEIKSVLSIPTPSAVGEAASDTSSADVADEKAVLPKPMKRWSTFSGAVTGAGGLGRRMSMKVKRASWAPGKGGKELAGGAKTNGSAVNGAAANGNANKPSTPGAKDAENERKVLEQLREEGPADQEGTEDALAKLTGSTPAAAKDGPREEAVVPVEVSTVPQNGTVVEPIAEEDTDEHTKRDGVIIDAAAAGGVEEEKINGAVGNGHSIQPAPAVLAS